MITSDTALGSPSVERDPERQELLERLFRHIGEVSSLPTAAMRVVQIANDPNTAADDLLAAVEGEPALAVRIMRTVNSGYYGLRNSVSNLKTAITLLGFLEVRNIALTIYVSRQFRQEVGYRFYRRDQLWQHLVAVATASRHIAKYCGKALGEDAYLAGLLHDMGLILIDQHMHKRFRQVLDRISEDVPTCDAELAVLTFDHAELGGFVANRWDFPEQVVAAIRHHHYPESYSGEHRNTVDVVAVANFLCSRRGLPSLGVHNVVAPGANCFSRLGIHQEALHTIWDNLEDTFAKADIISGI